MCGVSNILYWIQKTSEHFLLDKVGNENISSKEGLNCVSDCLNKTFARFNKQIYLDSVIY